jgi:uncharacterized phage protein (TIGR02220 family)|nr:MAG TPA: hypothetical protein [Bacteriophage sp.]
MKVTEREAIEYLNGRYLMVGSPANPSKEVCEKHNAVLELAIKALKEQEKLKRKYVTREQINEIVSYMNDVCGTSYRQNNKVTEKHINARFGEKYTVEDFKKVIDKKAAEWLGTDMEKFLRPETLFCSKFEGYLNQINTPKRKKSLADEWGNC